MSLSEQEVLQALLASRNRIAAAAWIVVRDAQAAEDIFQNVVVKALAKENCFPTEGAALSWAFITARREGIDWLRRRRTETPVLDADVLDLMDREWLSENSRADSRSEALQECVSEMPEGSRELLRLRYVEGHACKEVAKALGVGLEAVYQRLSRLHRALKGCIEQRLRKAEAVNL
jgi:RNA polymerase sigma-70 factor (ECF subfamily)